MFLDDILQFKDSFIEKCCIDKACYEEKGITNIEAFYWWSLVGLYRPSLIIESGVSRARSTEILARAQLHFDVKHHFAFDKEKIHREYSVKKLSKYKTVYELGDSSEKVKKLVDKFPEDKVLMFIDGPKHGSAYNSLVKSASKFKKLCAVASHDCGPVGKSSATRHALMSAQKKYLPKFNLYFSEPGFHSQISELNGFIMDEIIGKNPEFFSSNGYHYIGIAYK